MPAQQSDFDLLRPGILLSEDYKLIERIPRWVAGRRFLADHAGQRVQLLFFQGEAGENLEAWQKSLEQIQKLRKAAILPVLCVEKLRGFHFLVAEEVRGPSLRTKLDEEGPIAPEDAKDILAALRDVLRTMRQAGLEAPAVVPETILLVESDQGLHPVLFPWALTSYPATPEQEVSRRLRDLLYTATTNLEAPAEYTPRDLLALPPPVRRHWQGLFQDVPDWSALDEWIPISARSQLPPERPVAPAKTGNQTRSQGYHHESSQSGAKNSSQRGISRKPFAAWSAISAIASIAACVAVVWFSYSLIQSLRSPSFFDTEVSDFSLPAPKSAIPQNTTPSISAVPSPPPPSISVNESDSELMSTTTAALNPAMDRHIPPPDPVGAPGTNLMVWYERWQSNREDANFSAEFNNYLRELTPHADAMRSGRMPTLLAQLENLSKDGPPAAKFLLGQVLWGRETQRAEQLMKQLARNGYEPAKAWCEEQFIDW